ncbi:hypothetical protein ACFSCW_03405 [Sphingomonas tabacisoli]|uniref:Ribbon-helix-helix protein CopG domain-containing protein n=1 Tax=Sphingomonas tabacisoli TaxID=2249466 RepID=A0ABW4I0W4_9SPHN
MKQVAFRLDQKMIDKVAERIERDGITLSTFMRKALKDALEHDPGLPLPVLKNIVLHEASEEQVLAFRQALTSAMDEAFQRFCGPREEAAIDGAPLSQADWRLEIGVAFIRDGQPPTRTFARDLSTSEASGNDR